MPTQRQCLAYLATGFLTVNLVASILKPLVPFNDQVDLGKWLGNDISRGKCAEFNNFSLPKKRLKTFNEGNAWEVLDIYLSMRQDDSGYAKNWVGDMYLLAIHEGTKSDIDCSSPDSKCDGLKIYGEYRGWGSVFYIMKSMEDLFQYFKVSYRYDEALRGFLESDLEIFVDKFKIGSVEVDDKSLGPAKVLTAALNIAAGITAGIPVVLGVFTVSAGLSSLLE